MPQHALLRSTRCQCTPPQYAAARPVLPRGVNVRQGRRAVAVQAWTQVVDTASGKNYWWNTDTNETAWELPPTSTSNGAASTTSSSNSSSSATTSSSSSSSSSQLAPAQQQQQQQEVSMSSEALFDVLAEAYSTDGSGMGFWEVARAHRQQGVFDPPFFPDYLEKRQREAGSEAERELAFKMMCRLSNPLLRQPAPFE